MAEANFVEIVCPARAENVGVVRLAAASFAGLLPFSLPEVEEIKVAVSEAVTNAVVHAYPGRSGLVFVRLLRTEDGALQIEVRDEGVGIPDLEAARQKARDGSSEHLGLGFYFMETFADEFHVESRAGGGTTVRLRKRPKLPLEAQGAL